MRPIITFYLRRLLEGTDVQVNNIKKGTLSLRYVCKRQFSEPRNSRMAEGGHNPCNQENTFLVVGLGNLDRPKSRHSVGMQATDLIAKTCGTKFEKRKECQSMIASVQLNGVTLILMKPRLPMNLNGRCVSKTVRQYNIGSENIIIVHDNLDKATGVVKLKEKGGSASGHNGVKSVAASIKSGIPRILIGIDRPSSRDQEDIVEYVLEDFPKDEQSVIKGAVQKSVKVLGEVILKRTEIDILPELQGTDRNNNEVT